MPVDVAGPLIPSYELGIDELTRRAALVRENQDLCRRLVSAVLENRTPFPDSPHVEEQIYGGFYSRTDQALIDEFHQADWIRRLELSGRFSDPRLRTLSRRLVFCEAPDVMPAGVRRDYARAIAGRIYERTDTTGKWLTLDEAINEANELMVDCQPEQMPLLHAHVERLQAWQEDARLMLGSVATN